MPGMPGNPAEGKADAPREAGWEMTPDQERQDRLTRGGKNAMPMPPIKSMSRRQDLNAINPDAPGVIPSMNRQVPGAYEDT